MKILIVEDEEFFAESLTKFLSQDHLICVKNVSSATTAMKVVKDENYDLIICDLRLPDLNGEELIKKIAQKNPAQNFYIMSAYEIPELKLKSLGINIIKCFEKPFDMSDMKNSIINFQQNFTRQNQKNIIEDNHNVE